MPRFAGIAFLYPLVGYPSLAKVRRNLDDFLPALLYFRWKMGGIDCALHVIFVAVCVRLILVVLAAPLALLLLAKSVTILY